MKGGFCGSCSGLQILFSMELGALLNVPLAVAAQLRPMETKGLQNSDRPSAGSISPYKDGQAEGFGGG